MYGKLHHPLPSATDRLATRTLDAAFKVHRTLGPGLLESVYESCLCHELAQQQIPWQSQVGIPIVYDGLRLESGLRLDLLVDNTIVVELKAVEALLPLHEAQVLTYLKLSGKRLGLLINFNVPVLKSGIKRIIL
ncbi:MAG: GxxExxY protein [Chloroflexi bacterium]|nr:GxxExxY protein [Chloroflexota bacterium]